MRVEVIKDRVYLHPLPQWLDNLGYLVVCCPPKKSASPKVTSTPLGKVSVTDVGDEKIPIVAFVVDCGNAATVVEQVERISALHYDEKTIQIQSILSTHKHHDHTAGNKGLFEHETLGRSIKLVFGGAVEKVPCCNYPLRHGDLLPLPQYGENDMGDLIEVEAIATPGHTRGSLAFAMRPKISTVDQSTGSSFLFTGDTMFSAGSGVPFEADFESNQEEKANTMTPTSFINVAASNYAVERCFSEIIARSVPEDRLLRSSSDRVLIFPGHEYTTELLHRQLAQNGGDSTRWKHFSPSYFFEVASHYYVALHRRALPHSSGKLLSAPTSLRRELLINPQLRMLHKRGQLVIRAVHLWHDHFAKVKIVPIGNGYSRDTTVETGASPSASKTISSYQRWNLDASDIDRPVFSTVYTADLDLIIADLDSGRITHKDAAEQLRQMKAMIETPTIGRRPIPDTLPSNRIIFRTLLGFVLLGSTPSALTLSDSISMKLPPPVVSTSDRIRINKSRLVAVLHWLGLVEEENEKGKDIVAMISQLWKETREYSEKMSSFDADEDGTVTYKTGGDVEVEIRNESDYEIQLGALRWMVYGIPQKPPSFLEKTCCVPCSSSPPLGPPSQPHPIEKSGLSKHSGELVRHDLFNCLLCHSMAGCPIGDEDGLTELNQNFASPNGTGHRPPLNRMSSTQTYDDDGQSIELTHDVLNLLREA